MKEKRAEQASSSSLPLVVTVMAFSSAAPVRPVTRVPVRTVMAGWASMRSAR
ncbi:hypothetical protein D3C83_147630 [compost metagenome]